jgi:hypothetical protein
MPLEIGRSAADSQRVKRFRSMVPAKIIYDKYLMILRRDHGKWKIARLMWSPAT